jgi:hypothetical protein
MATRTDKVNTPVVPAKTDVGAKTDLGTLEAQKARDTNAKRIASQDAARIAQQAGFQRLGTSKKRNFDVGDSSRSPIPIPDENEDDVWTQERLDSAQENLMMASAQFAEAARSPEAGGSLAEALVGSSFLPTESDTAGLQALADKEPPPPMALDDVTTDVKRLFNIELKDEVPLGHKVLATGLVVAGEAGCVSVDQGGLNEQNLANGLQKVTERGNQAVGEAQKMSKGISRELNVQRTFVFKR